MYDLFRCARTKIALLCLFSMCQGSVSLGASSFFWTSLKTSFLNNSLVKKINDQSLPVRTAIWGTAALAVVGSAYVCYLRGKRTVSQRDNRRSNGVYVAGNNNIVDGISYFDGGLQYPMHSASDFIVDHSAGKHEEAYEFENYCHLVASYPFSAGGTVGVSNFYGHVSIEAADVEQLMVEIELDPKVLRSPIRASISVDPASSFAYIKVTDVSKQANIAAMIRILVPRTTNVDVETVSGDITTTNRIGSTRAHTSNGKITVADLVGSAELCTSNGSINADNVVGAITSRF